MKPPKTPLEQELSIHYQSEMKRYDIVPQSVIDAFKKDVIRVKNQKRYLETKKEIKMEKFKGTKQAEIYANSKSSSDVFKRAHITDFLAGYNKAIEDTSAPEMLEMLNMIHLSFGGGRVITFSDKDIEDIARLISKITE